MPPRSPQGTAYTFIHPVTEEQFVSDIVKALNESEVCRAVCSSPDALVLGLAQGLAPGVIVADAGGRGVVLVLLLLLLFLLHLLVLVLLVLLLRVEPACGALRRWLALPFDVRARTPWCAYVFVMPHAAAVISLR